MVKIVTKLFLDFPRRKENCKLNQLNRDSHGLATVWRGFLLRIIVKAFTEMSDEDFKWIKNPPSAFIARIYFDPLDNNFFMREPLPVRSPDEIEK